MNRRRTPRAGLLIGLAVGTLVSGCSTPEFHRHFEAGRYLEASAAFEGDSTLHADERALFRSGVLHARPESPAYDPERARRDFNHLLTLYPETPYRPQAQGFLSLLRDLERHEVSLAHERRELEAALRELSGERERRERAEGQLDEREQDVLVLRRVAERLEALLREREREIDSLRRDLERLKAIDLGRGRPAETDPERSN